MTTLTYEEVFKSIKDSIGRDIHSPYYDLAEEDLIYLFREILSLMTVNGSVRINQDLTVDINPVETQSDNMIPYGSVVFTGDTYSKPNNSWAIKILSQKAGTIIKSTYIQKKKKYE